VCGPSGIVQFGACQKEAGLSKQITGRVLLLDHEQEQALLARAGADASGTWTSRYSQLPFPLSQVKPVFADGFLLRSMSGSMSEDLVLAEAFYALLYAHVAAGAASELA
jgi:hypothetical protein